MNELPTDVRARILRAANDLLANGGKDAVSTRAVSAAAGVQAPTIYRQFGDMRGLLEEVARETLAGYLEQKLALEMTDDPIEDLRRGWDLHVAFGLANPAAYVLINVDEASVPITPAKAAAMRHLRTLIERVAASGRLRVGVEHAARMVSAACKGVVLSLISTPSAERDLRVSASVREAVLTGITTTAAAAIAGVDATGTSRVAARAVAMRAVLGDAPGVLSSAESQLMGEWLDRLADAGAHAAAETK